MIPKQETSVSIEPWYPTPDASGQPTQLHVIIDQGGGTFVMRFHSGEGVDRFVNALLEGRLAVWGES